MPAILLTAIFMPLAGALLVLLGAGQGRAAVRQSALVTSVVTLALTAILVVSYDPSGGPFALTETSWLGPTSSIDVRFAVALDGLSLWLFALSALLLFTIRPLLLKLLHRGEPAKTNVDALYGMGGRVVAAFVDGEGGSVRLDNGETWTARLAAGAVGAGVGVRVTVDRVLGATVEVSPATPASPASTEGSTP